MMRRFAQITLFLAALGGTLSGWIQFCAILPIVDYAKAILGVVGLLISIPAVLCIMVIALEET